MIVHDWLDEVIGTELSRVPLEDSIGVPRHDDRRNGTTSRDQQLQPVEVAQAHVEQKKIGRFRVEYCERPLKGVGRQHPVTVVGEEPSEPFPRCPIVVDNQ